MKNYPNRGFGLMPSTAIWKMVVVVRYNVFININIKFIIEKYGSFTRSLHKGTVGFLWGKVECSRMRNLNPFPFMNTLRGFFLTKPYFLSFYEGFGFICFQWWIFFMFLSQSLMWQNHILQKYTSPSDVNHYAKLHYR